MFGITDAQQKDVETALAYLAAPPDNTLVGFAAIRQMAQELAVHTTSLRNFSAYALFYVELMNMPLTVDICTQLAGGTRKKDGVILGERLNVVWDETGRNYHFSIGDDSAALEAETVNTLCRELAGMANLCGVTLDWSLIKEPLWFVPEFDLAKVVADGFDTPDSWKAWLSKESGLPDDGNDPIPPDYYEKLTGWWKVESENPQLCRFPVIGYLRDEKLHLLDGKYRVALTHMLGHETIPVNIVLQYGYKDKIDVSSKIPKFAFEDLWRTAATTIHGEVL